MAVSLFSRLVSKSSQRLSSHDQGRSRSGRTVREAHGANGEGRPRPRWVGEERVSREQGRRGEAGAAISHGSLRENELKG